MAKTLTILRRLFGGHDEDRCVRGSRCRIYNGRRSRSHEQGLQDESSPLVCSGVLREEWEGAKPWWTDASARASRCTSRLGSGFLSTLPFAIKRPATRGDRAPRWRVFNSLVRRPSPRRRRRKIIGADKLGHRPLFQSDASKPRHRKRQALIVFSVVFD